MQPHLIANTWINSLLNQLEKTGISLTAVSERLPELELQHIRDGQRIDINQVRQIWHIADDLAQDPLLGYKIGSNISLKALGVLTPILMHSPTPRHSLENIVQYANLITESILFSLEEREGYLVFEVTPVAGSIRENPHHVVSMLVNMFTMSNQMGVRGNRIEKMTLPDSLDLEFLSQHMKQNIEGRAQPPYGIYFTVQGQDDILPGSDNHLYQLNKAYAEELIQQKRAGNDLLESIKQLIIEQGYQRANVDRVTDQLGISKRSLQRQLAEAKTSFRNLKEEVIKDRALLLIAQADIAIDQISVELGYSEVSAFHRAFKGWFGVTPKEYAENPAIQL